VRVLTKSTNCHSEERSDEESVVCQAPREGRFLAPLEMTNSNVCQQAETPLLRLAGGTELVDGAYLLQARRSGAASLQV
jgi:hypothetical protein